MHDHPIATIDSAASTAAIELHEAHIQTVFTDTPAYQDGAYGEHGRTFSRT